MTIKMYGITKYSMETYRGLMLYGLLHDTAMLKLKALYLVNKALHDNPPDYSCIYGHPHYGGKSVLDGLQADKS